MGLLVLECSALPLPRRPGALLALVAATVASLAATPAAAQSSRVVRASLTSFTCQPMQSCDVATPTCDTANANVMTGDVCQTVPSGTNLACYQPPQSYGPGELFCCQSDTDCGSVDGLPGTCLLDFGIDGSGVCYYGLLDYCVGASTVADAGVDGGVDSPSVDALLKCLAPTGTGSLLQDFLAGDCDGDRISNGSDPCPCDPMNACVVDYDGGLLYDAGPSTHTLSFTGKGGCSIAPAAQSALPSLLWLLPGAALIARRRRR